MSDDNVKVNIILTGHSGSVDAGTVEKVADDQYNLWISQLTTIHRKKPWYKRLWNWIARK